MNLLHIETSGKLCSVASSTDGEVMFAKTIFEPMSHSAYAGAIAEETLKHMGGTPPDAVAVSAGPGSYTGLRIGVSLAKGLCVGWGVPLIAVPTPEVIAAMAQKVHRRTDCLYCALIDARRMEVYATLFDGNLKPLCETRPEIITPESFATELVDADVCFCGDGAEKCRDVIRSPRASFLGQITPVAAEMVPIAERAYAERRFVDTAYFEPFYLKEFVATTPRKKI